VTVAGVDACRGGWLVVADGPDGLRRGVFPRFGEVIDWLAEDAVVGVDIPIGLPEAGPRACDRLARGLLGPRRSLVFPAPLRAVLAARDYAEACTLRSRIEGRRMSRQAWNLVAKIKDVDELLARRAGLDGRVFEVHPELAFRELAGGCPMSFPKRTGAGRAQRFETLVAHFGRDVGDALDWRRGRGCAADDVLDAFAVLWSARRIGSGRALCLPDAPPTDRAGRPMRILA